MSEIGNGELADAEVPVRMSGPLDVEVVAPIKIQLYVFALEFVDDRAIVNTVNRDALAVAFVVKARSLLLDVDDVDRPDAQHFLGEQKIGERLLFLRMNLHQDNIFGIVFADDGAAQEIAI